MEPDFWHQKWAKREIGFHQPQGNPLLTAHFQRTGLEAPARVFVPLCGKTRDIAWLRSKGLQVVAAELSETAVKELFAELELCPGVDSHGPLKRYHADNLVVWVGDIFSLQPEMLANVDLVYDRAALVALPPALRQRYSQHLLALTQSAPQLVINFEYDQSLRAGPPFSVTEADLRAYYAASHHIEDLAHQSLKLGKEQVDAHECLWLLKPHP